MSNPVTNLGLLDGLSKFPRTPLMNGETVLERLPNFEAALKSGPLYAKRDDCNTLTFGGNKVRQLEYYFGEAQRQGADTILITGAVQSNFVRLAAAGAVRLGMQCHVQLEERVADTDAHYRNSGNVLLDKMLGATLHSYPVGEDEEGADRQLAEIADDLKKNGRNPYVIPLGPGHPPLGSLGYVLAAIELLEQFATLPVELGQIVVASGSGATHAGLLCGLRAAGSPVTVHGICVRRNAKLQAPRILERCGEIEHLLGLEPTVTQRDVIVNDKHLAPGYGVAGDDTMAAILQAARQEALMLDPTYTGKCMAGFLELARTNTESGAIVFVHTGGTPGIFAYQSVFERAFRKSQP